MWLLSTDRAELHYFASPEVVPEGYAILSHVWGQEEQTFQDVQRIRSEANHSGERSYVTKLPLSIPLSPRTVPYLSPFAAASTPARDSPGCDRARTPSSLHRCRDTAEGLKCTLPPNYIGAKRRSASSFSCLSLAVPSRSSARHGFNIGTAHQNHHQQYPPSAQPLKPAQGLTASRVETE